MYDNVSSLIHCMSETANDMCVCETENDICVRETANDMCVCETETGTLYERDSE